MSTWQHLLQPSQLVRNSRKISGRLCSAFNVCRRFWQKFAVLSTELRQTWAKHALPPIGFHAQLQGRTWARNIGRRNVHATSYIMAACDVRVGKSTAADRRSTQVEMVTGKWKKIPQISCYTYNVGAIRFERMFSLAGAICNRRRASLITWPLECVGLSKCNQWLVEEIFCSLCQDQPTNTFNLSGSWFIHHDMTWWQ